MMYGFDGFGAWGMGFGMLFALIVWVLIAVGLVLMVRWLWSARSEGRIQGPPASALQILGKHYARGEIGKPEYEEKKRDLDARNGA